MSPKDALKVSNPLKEAELENDIEMKDDLQESMNFAVKIFINPLVKFASGFATNAFIRYSQYLVQKLLALTTRIYNPICKSTLFGDSQVWHYLNNGNVMRENRYRTYADHPIARIAEYLSIDKQKELIYVDIVANIGLTALSVHSKVKKNVVYHLYEGHDFHYKLLKVNTRQLNVASIKLRVVGSPDEATEGFFIEIGGTSSFIPQEATPHDIHSGKANKKKLSENKSHNVVSLNQILSDSKGDLVKIDTDGYERKILVSGQEGLQEYKPLVFCEFNPTAEIAKGYETTNYGIFEILQKVDYINIAAFYQGRLLFAGDITQNFNIFKCFEDFCLGAVVGDLLAAHKDKKETFMEIINAERQRNRDIAIKSRHRWLKRFQ